MSDYHARIMNIPCEKRGLYAQGHRDARHAAAEIVLEAQAEVETLTKALVFACSAAQRLLTANAVREHEGLSHDEWEAVVLRAAEELDAGSEPFEGMSETEYAAAVALAGEEEGEDE